jgi:hypothetical protein
VTHLRSAVFLSLLAVLAVTGCEKTNDMPRLQEEATATAASYKERIEELIQRGQALSKRYAELPRDLPDTMNVQRTFLHARGALERAGISLRQAGKRIQGAVDTGKSDEIAHVITAMHDDLDASIRETTTELSAVDSWLSITEQRRTTATTATTAVPAAAALSAGATVPTGDTSTPPAPER